MRNRIYQAYRQAPWRTQVQWIGLFVLVLVVVGAVAGIYLNISARASTAGRDIQELTSDIDAEVRTINDLNASLAGLTSAATMGKRAVDMGFQPVEIGESVYMAVPGYAPRASAVLAPPPGPGIIAQPIIQPDYTESLWDWLFNSPILSPEGQQVQR